jgi:hypothetical protein
MRGTESGEYRRSHHPPSHWQAGRLAGCTGWAEGLGAERERAAVFSQIYTLASPPVVDKTFVQIKLTREPPADGA